jgi:hypothetical protein
MKTDYLSRLRELSAKIDLGKTWKLDPPAPLAMTPKSRTDYPDLYIYDRPGLENFPRSGKAVIEYKIERFTITNRDGKVSNDLTLQIKSIEPIEDKDGKLSRKAADDGKGKARPLTVNLAFPIGGERPESPLSIRLKKKPLKPGGVAAIGGKGGTVSGGGKLLERLRGVTRLLDDRLRNGNGQFIANQTGGADPNSMDAAYKQPRKKPLTARAGATIGGAAAGLAAGCIIGTGIAKVQDAGERLASRVAARG